MAKKERLGSDPFKVIIGTPIFRPGKGTERESYLTILIFQIIL